MNPGAVARLVQAVRTNCHIADARHAADLTLCNYLLQMREFFRWERGLPFGATLSRAEVGEWIAAREALWDDHEARAFEALPLPGGEPAFDPFDVDAINARLVPFGLLYGAGLIGGGRPVFFVAHCHATDRREGVRIQQAGHELARGLVAPPAALAAGPDGPIVVRRESLARLCWERFEAFSLRPAAGTAFAAVVQAYGFERGFAAALPRWLDDHTEVALLHELGEHRVGARFGEPWRALRLALPSHRVELMVAAVRDHLVDLEYTLPTLLARGAEAPVHAWFAGYDGLREALFPGLMAAYRQWRQCHEGTPLQRAIEHGHAHFVALATEMLALHARGGPAVGQAIAELLASERAVCRLDGAPLSAPPPRGGA
jgi:hypothetical protein